MVIESLALGMGMGLIYYEVLGFSPGGMIAPGYLAMLINQPTRVVATLMVSLLTWLLVRNLSQVVILYGRRRFVLTILVGFLISRLVEAAPWTGGYGEIRAIGYIVPGLIANDIENQGFLPTLASLLAVAAIVRLVLYLLTEWGILL